MTIADYLINVGYTEKKHKDWCTEYTRGDTLIRYYCEGLIVFSSPKIPGRSRLSDYTIKLNKPKEDVLKLLFILGLL